MEKKKRLQKGEYGYLKRQKKIEIIRTIIYFAISFSILALGIYSTKTKANLLTLVAILGMLPASKSAVSMVIYLKAPDYDETVYQELKEKLGGVSAVFGMYLTSYQKNFALSCVAIRGNNLIAFSEFAKCDRMAGEEHIQTLAKQNGFKSLSVKIFTDQKKFEDRLLQLQTLEHGQREEDVLDLICHISL